ncbi:hypothetical protein [Thermocatellispora tengchongensis]
MLVAFAPADRPVIATAVVLEAPAGPYDPRKEAAATARVARAVLEAVL